MSLSLIGLNYKTASLDLREQLAFSEFDCRAFTPELIKNSKGREALVLSTCSRVEILLERDWGNALPAVVNLLSDAKKIAPERFEKQLYHLSEKDAARHLFRVAASLDSMVVGETQILGQVRAAYKTAIEAGTVGRVLHRLLQSVLRGAKRVHTETRIAANAASLSKSAVELARETVNGFAGKTVLLVGAGVMAKLAARCLAGNDVKEIFVVNRTFAAAVKLAAECGGKAVALKNLSEVLPRADIVICSTAAGEILIDAEMISTTLAARLRRRALFIDLSVPRNISPQIAGICENISLRSVDDLEEIGRVASGERQGEIRRAEKIIAEEFAAFGREYQTSILGRSSLERKRNSAERISPMRDFASEHIPASFECRHQ